MKEKHQAVGGASAVVAFAGSLVGAGFASGREIYRFFARYGPLSWWGVGLSGMVLGLFCWVWLYLSQRTGEASVGGLCRKLIGGRMEFIGGGVFMAIMAVTAGSMLAAGGELWSLIGGPQMRIVGLLLTALAGWWIARRGLGGLARAGWWLLPTTLLLFAALALSQKAPGLGDLPRKGMPLLGAVTGMGIISGALNAAQSASVLCEAGSRLKARGAIRVAAGCGLVGGLLVAVANAALLRWHAVMELMPLPTLEIAALWGAPAQLAVSGVLWMAMFSTLATVLRGMKVQLDAWLMPLAQARPQARFWRMRQGLMEGLVIGFGVSRLGFVTIIELGYPLLGACCGVLACVLMVKARKRQSAISSPITDTSIAREP